MSEPVGWDVAEKVGVRIADRFGDQGPSGGSYRHDDLTADFEELTAEAEVLVSEATGLVSQSGPARARVTDRAGWVRANVASFQRMLAPLTDRLSDRMPKSAAAAKVTRALTGVEVGALLGWMSTRVLGQYDLLIVDDDTASDQDLVYYVGPNVVALEQRFRFPPRQFRLWLALHEVTHRAQFTGVPWLRGHFLSLVDASLGSIEPDPKRFVSALRRAAEEVRAGRNPLDEGGLVALLATAEQQELLARIGGLMSLLEGHGDITMDRAGADRIPSAPRFGRVLHQRRAQASAPAKLVQKVIGLDAKLKQYEQGERFIEAVEAEGGPGYLARAWERPEHLPTLAEIRDPAAWMRRVVAPVPGGAAAAS
ncbi:MAG: zinc-dependent metalloprotease [Actinomycetota bacterium]|nr:zinc-dependent metalloprotease [Actinomycetota bacterium]